VGAGGGGSLPASGPAVRIKPGSHCETRYISTELGMRQRLLVGVLTSKSTLGTLAVARLVYFTGTRGRKVPHGMTVVTHGDERPIWNMYQTVRYLLEHYVNDFDWFFLVQDDTYTEAHRINRLVAHLSIDTLLYLGRPEEFIGGDTDGRYCYGGFGFLLSRSLLLRLQPHLESCRNDILSSRPDEWLGRCIIDHTAVSCTEEHEGLLYQYFELGKNVNPEHETDLRFQSAFTVHPVLDPVQMYRLHKYFAQVELERTYLEIEQLQLEIQNASSLSADGDHSATWPVGIPPPFQPKTRFEVLRWDYFTEDQVYACVDGSPKCELQGVDLADVADCGGHGHGGAEPQVPAGAARPQAAAGERVPALRPHARHGVHAGPAGGGGHTEGAQPLRHQARAPGAAPQRGGDHPHALRDGGQPHQCHPAAHGARPRPRRALPGDLRRSRLREQLRTPCSPSSSSTTPSRPSR
uniref:Hexosyltransferase n=1 Tax=Anas platyrhynchos TaxID=8839 RepID=A0A8B9Z8P3_ANAPL